MDSGSSSWVYEVVTGGVGLGERRESEGEQTPLGKSNRVADVNAAFMTDYLRVAYDR